MDRMGMPKLVAVLATSVLVAAGVGPVPYALAGDREAGLRLDGVHLEGGLVSPLHSDDAAIVGAGAHLGTVLAPWLDFTAGVRRWSSDLDRSRYALDGSGRIRDFMVYAGLEYGLPTAVKGARPYAAAGLAAHFLGAEIPESPQLQDSIDGLRNGAWVGFGLMTVREGLGLRLQMRRDFVEQADAWSATVGVGWWPRVHAEARDELPEGEWLVAPVAPQVSVAAAPEIAAEPSPAADPEPAKAPVTEPAPVPEPEPAVEPTPAPAPSAADDAFRQDLARAAATAGDPKAIRRDVDQLVLSLGGTLVFATGSESLDIAGREMLRRVAAILLRYPQVSTAVEGHTDDVGDAERNRQLSLRRAQAVRDELAGLGVPASRLTLEGFGESRPIGDNATRDGRAQNRRVDLRFDIGMSAR